MTIGSLFSGIGGLELGLERAGLGPVLWQAERDAFCRAVLAKHWPDAHRFSDVREVTSAAAARVDVLCGGFPCQPVSVAGKRLAQDDPRWLWPEFARIAAELRPRAIVVENVPGLRTAGLRDVLADLAALGFDAEWTHLGAGEVGAPHLRDRLFLVATDADRVQLRDEPGWLARAADRACAPVPRDAVARCLPSDSDPVRRLEQARSLAVERGWSRYCGWELGAIARVDDGVPRGTHSARRKALGNAVVVAVAEVIGRALKDILTLSEAA